MHAKPRAKSHIGDGGDVVNVSASVLNQRTSEFGCLVSRENEAHHRIRTFPGIHKDLPVSDDKDVAYSRIIDELGKRAEHSAQGTRNRRIRLKRPQQGCRLGHSLRFTECPLSRCHPSPASDKPRSMRLERCSRLVRTLGHRAPSVRPGQETMR